MKKRLEETGRVETEILDLREVDLPMLEERFRNIENPSDRMADFQRRIAAADALVVVSPEYNHGYPAVLKNMFDHFLPEFRRKPIGIITVSAGSLGGIDCLGQLRHVTLWMGALPIPAAFPVTKVAESFDEEGRALDPSYERRSERFLEELLWFTEATVRQRQQENGAGG
jgi:NAD(P)H-dependent FMN reductase